MRAHRLHQTAGQRRGRASVQLLQQALNACAAKLLAAGVGRLEDTVGQQHQPVAGLERQVHCGAHVLQGRRAQREAGGAVHGARALRSPEVQDRPLATAEKAQAVRGRVEQADEGGDEAAVGQRLGQAVVDAAKRGSA